MKSLLKTSVSIVLALICATTALAYDFKSGELCYNINPDSLSVTVTYEYYNTSNYSSLPDSISIPDSVVYLEKNYIVTAVGSYAFNSCHSLKSVTLPNSVTTICNKAFCFVEALSNLNLNSVTTIGDSAFYCCSSLFKVNIPNTVTFIGNGAFQNCRNLYNVVISNSITSISARTFSGCRNLRGIDIPNTVTSIGEGAFEFCSSLSNVIIPNSVTAIEDKGFYYCRDMVSISIPNSVKSIGNHSFRDCASLRSVVIPNSVISIGYMAFAGCDNLKQFVLGKSVKSIGDFAFSNTLALNSIVIPQSVSSIGASPFDGCINLKSILVDSKNLYYDSRDSCNAVIETGTNTLISGCRTTTIPNSVITIGMCAFGGCKYLRDIEIPFSVTTIDDFAFSGCENLKSIIIPNSVSSIGEGVFLRCYGLGNIIIHGSVNSIGDYAFTYCNNLKRITCKAKTPPTIYSNTFYEFPKSMCVLYVPVGSVNTYTNTQYWKDIKTIQNIIGVASLSEDFETMPETSDKNVSDVEGAFSTWKFKNAHVVASTDAAGSGDRMCAIYKGGSLTMLDPEKYMVDSITFNCFNTSSIESFFKIYRSTDGSSWALVNESPLVVAPKTSGVYSVAVNSEEPSYFRIACTVGPNTKTLFIDDLTFHYTVPDGDVNHDCCVDIDDLNLVVNALLKIDDNPNADVDFDDKIDIDDLNMVINMMLGR